MVNTISVQDMIRRSNRNTLLLTILGIVILIVGAATAAPYWLQTLAAPKVLTPAEAIAIAPESLPMYNVQITGEQMLDTGYEEYTTEDGRRTTTDAYFGALVLGEKLLIVRVTASSNVDESKVDYAGMLTMPAGISSEVHVKVVGEAGEYGDAILPYVLDTIPDQFPWLAGAAVLAIVLLLVLYGLFQYITRSSNASRHPIMKGLARFGDANAVLDQINGELMTTEQKQSFPGLSFTRNWLVYAKGTNFEAAHMQDIMWIYPQAVRNKYGTTYYTHLWDRHGRLINVQGSEMQVNEMINAVLSRAPWAIGGYSEDIKKSWNSNRQSFIATVDSRRQQQGQSGAY